MNKWIEHWKKFKAAHPEMKNKEAMKAAKETYKKEEGRKDE